MKIWPFSRSESSTTYGTVISIFLMALIGFIEVFIYVLFYPPPLQYWLIMISMDLVIYFASSIFLFQFLSEPLIQLLNRVKHTSITLNPVPQKGLRGEFGEILRDVDRLAETLKREREGLLETYSEYRNIVESLDEGILTVDENKDIATMNKGLERIFSTTRGQWKGRQFEEFLRFYGIILDETKNVVRVKTLDKRLIFQEIPMNTSHSLMLYIFEDITALSNLEKALGRAEQLALLGKMTASIAHEIKTPLASMKLSVQLLKRQTEGISDEARETLDILDKEIRRLEERSMQFLTFSKTTYDLKPLNVVDVLEESIKLARIRARERGISIEFTKLTDKLVIEGDDNALNSAFLNVLVNAMDASRDNEKIEVKIEKMKNYALITFTDHGSGIPPDYMDYLFEPFFTLKTNGTGLGMSIVRRVVNSHGGRVEVKSQKEVGTSVIIRLPLSR
ncbi:sensor histidine kinase [Athalassotoga saccharophila]|uniref:sensor histidine kinase n=1 Tax=Athalassotoga saccharophila TaxID=1441386 RepID=UPI00137B8054|nr:ATP-binding protein [Athalassotoga saccharophila]BBJ27765.1 signal transduction histidine-protein kinase AtoS [Athalassotoga saccharophila]